ncbi:sulfotransferase [Nocardioides sp. dk4132]|uniref:sulfotransferase family protein n=1 Tax=unclassified Nocardioides TaxID=2615069 RepID=UPI0012958298|nr:MULTISPECIES: sulfotransferase [unclassified Nocardioides]MQW74768.1 sulfotransferase [Nocardioides sp. dk4132]QGA06665.1 sulfotransferase [Nocardioides sp. dk884]
MSAGARPGSGLKDGAPRWIKDAANRTTRAYGVATSPWRPAPDFLVIGTKRGGTTSMFDYLLQHPGLLGLYPQVRGKKSTDYFFRETHRGERWYRSHFHARPYRAVLGARLGHAPLGGEASPYYVWDPRIAAAVRRVAPGVRSIMLVRDPVKRAWSHYQERVENGVEPLGFADALAAEEDRTAGELERMAADPTYYATAHDWYSYRARGIYLPQIRNWLASFPPEQLLVLRSEDLYADPQAVLDRTCAFLGLPPARLSRTSGLNASRRSDPVPARERDRLAQFFAPHNAELEQFLGRPLGWT